MKKNNTSVITGRIIRDSVLKGMIPGGIASALILLALLLSGERYYLSSVFTAVILLFVAFVLLGLFIGWIRSNGFKTAVKNQEKNGIGRFDDEILRPITSDAAAWLGDHWLLMFDGQKYYPYNKSHIVSCNAVNERKEGMKKLWLGLVTDQGEKPAVIYAACEPDTLAVVGRWLGTAPDPAPAGQPSFSQPDTAVSPNPPEPSVRMQDAAPTVSRAAGGSCPFCFGPNGSDAKFCQWCGKQIR